MCTLIVLCFTHAHMSPTGHKWLSSSPRTTSLSPSVHTSERGTRLSLQTRVSWGNPSTSTSIQRIISRTSLLSFYTPSRESQLPRVCCLQSYRWWVESLPLLVWLHIKAFCPYTPHCFKIGLVSIVSPLSALWFKRSWYFLTDWIQVLFLSGSELT